MLLLATALGWLALTLRPAASSIPLDPHIPNEQALIDAGLSGTPQPNQPTSPLAVDRVLVDGAATYVQFHLTESSGPHLVLPRVTISDDQGGLLNATSRGSAPFSSGWASLFLSPLLAWSPWRPPLLRRGYYIVDAPLPATARAAVLHIVTRGGPVVWETVRVPLNLRALVRQSVSHPRTLRVLNVAQGLTMSVAEITDTHLILEYSPDGAPMPASLTSASGTIIHLTNLGSSCGGSTTSGLSCRAIWIFPPQRRGTRLTLTIPAFELTATAALGTGIVVHGPWRSLFLAP